MKHKKMIIGILLLMQSVWCHSQERGSSARARHILFATTFNSRYNDKILLLGCMLYSASGKGLRFDNQGVFLKLAGDFTSYLSLGTNNIDSLIDIYVGKNKTVNFKVEKAYYSIAQFVQNYNIVSDLIFSEVDSDDKTAAMEKVKKKILKVPALARIYQSYLKDRPDMSSLSSSEGNALYIQMAYYLSLQSTEKRNQLLSVLL